MPDSRTELEGSESPGASSPLAGMRPAGSGVERMLHAERDYALATYGPLYIVIWRINTTTRAMVNVQAKLNDFARLRKNGIALLTIVEVDAPIPEGESREAVARFLRDSAWAIRCSAVVHEGAGFRASLVRAVVTGLTLAAHQPFPHKVFASVPLASAWLARSMHDNRVGSLSAQDLDAAIVRIRAYLGSGPTSS
jgi:hypothetical protein